MRLSSLTLEGLAAAPSWTGDGFDNVHLLSPDAHSVALADGLSLLHAALDADRALDEVRLLGLSTDASATLVTDGALDQVESLDPIGVSDLLAPGTHRHLTVDAGFEADPLLFRTLRDVATKEARLLSALGQGGSLRVRVGWLFNRAGTHASVSVTSLQVGDERFSTTRTDRPPWIPALLADLARRIHRVDTTDSEATLGERWQTALLSPDRLVRDHASRALTALGSPPFGLGDAALVVREGRPRLGFGPALLPARAAGSHALTAARWAWAAYVVRPDVLVVDHAGPPGAAAWWREVVEADDAPIAQVLVVAPGVREIA